jgi:hypothetical protein
MNIFYLTVKLSTQLSFLPLTVGNFQIYVIPTVSLIDFTLVSLYTSPIRIAFKSFKAMVTDVFYYVVLVVTHLSLYTVPIFEPITNEGYFVALVVKVKSNRYL